MDDYTIVARFKRGNTVITATQWRYDYGRNLRIENVDLPPNYEVHFSNEIDGKSKPVIGGPEGVAIPDEYFNGEGQIYAWVFVVDGERGMTKKMVMIPLQDRGERTEDHLEPHEINIVDQAVDLLNEAIDAIPAQIDAALEEAKESGEFDGPQGEQGPQGDPFTYEDFTPEQLEGLRGPEGLPGNNIWTVHIPPREERTNTRAISDVQIDDVYFYSDLQGRSEADPLLYDYIFYPETGALYVITALRTNSVVIDEQCILKPIDGSTIWTTTATYSKPVVNNKYYFTASQVGGGVSGARIKLNDILIQSNAANNEYNCFYIKAFLYSGVMLDCRLLCNMHGPAGQNGADGFSPVVTVTDISGGHRVSITDANGTQSFDVMDGTGGSGAPELAWFTGALSSGPGLSGYTFTPTPNFGYAELNEAILAGQTPVIKATITTDSQYPGHEDTENVYLPLTDLEDVFINPDAGGEHNPNFTKATFSASHGTTSWTIIFAYEFDRVSEEYVWVWSVKNYILAKTSEVGDKVTYFDFLVGDDIDDTHCKVETYEIANSIYDAYLNGSVFARVHEDDLESDHFTVLGLTEVEHVSQPNYLRLSFSNTTTEGTMEIELYFESSRVALDNNGWLIAYTELATATYVDNAIDDSGFVDAAGAADAAPVQSVNGQTGAVMLMASDVGAGTYSKPSGGIPASDLASAVQTSLGKADTALQSAPVSSVNGQTGAVSLSIPSTAADVGAIAAPSSPTDGAFLVYRTATGWGPETLSAWQGGSY